jgi:hypothetical protein
VLSGLGIDRELARSHALGEPLAQTMVFAAARAEPLQLRSGAQDDELGQFDPITAQLASEFIQRGLDLCCLGERVAAALGRHGGV